MSAILSWPQCVKQANHCLFTCWIHIVTVNIPSTNASWWGIASTQWMRPWQNGRHSAHDDVIKWKHFPRYWPFEILKCIFLSESVRIWFKPNLSFCLSTMCHYWFGQWLWSPLAVQSHHQNQWWPNSPMHAYGVTRHLYVNSTPSAAYMRQWVRSAFVQIRVWRLFGAKPLSQPKLGYCQLDP